ncbi:AfsR/SARP family transcriptional regulator [Rhizohabitans arisaemae]|uniref:AfsR/SARP family transcriptional regulator n=1 Tax=Rhizohabitans arisaemae TaxID=2720610 RepID=UPI0024B1C3B2|nr:BTAD domain-containing putative transcriptional regulator [Rhizohabitans arisaemae]
MHGDIQVSLWGPLAVSTDRRPVAVPGGRLRTLLVCLALEGGGMVSTDTLTERMWADRLPGRPRGALQTNITRLRRLLGPQTVETVAHGYALRIRRQDVDLLRFRELAARARRAAAAGTAEEEMRLLREALALRRGEPFGGVDSSWLERELAPQVEEEWFAALTRRFDLEMAAGYHDGVLPELWNLAAAYPLREPVWERLMLALQGAGRRADALQVYRQARSVLREELGLEPGRRLRRLHGALLQGTPDDTREGLTAPGRRPAVPTASASVPLRQLPSDVSRFTGREDTLAELDAVLHRSGAQHGPGTEPASRPIEIAVVSGPAGVGKTALAVRWAHAVRDRFPDGQLYLDLRGYGTAEPVEPSAALGLLLQALDVPAARLPVGVDMRAALLRSVLTGRRMLIVLDNARDSAQVRPLLPGSQVFVLVTSRNQLRGLGALAGAHRVTVHPLRPPESLALLGEILGPAAPPAALGYELAELCGRLPLALCIAAELAGRQPADGPADLVRRLRAQRDRLNVLSTGDDPQGDLRSVLSWSYRALTPPAAHLFRLLSLHPGGAAVEEEAVAALLGVPIPDARRSLDELVRAHQLVRHGLTAHAMQELVRLYAAERLDEEETRQERSAAVRRLREWSARTPEPG